MKTTGLIASALMAMALPALAAEPQVGTGETDGYKLVWQDLFDGTELNMSRWNIEVNGDGGGNNELQYYTARLDNVRVGDDGEGNGCLILTAKKEVYNGKQCTSGRITTKNKIAFKHGKIEAAIKLPQTANGLWPAFWMMGNDFDQVGWPRCGETDIMEFGNATGIANGTQDRYFNGACHWGTAWNDHRQYANAITNSYSLQDGEFHIYTCIWDQDKVAMYVDLDRNPNASPYYIMTIPETTTDQTHPGYYFHKENFILFNLAVGGNFPGIRDINGITALNEGNNYQQSMYVNYVKIYQKGTSDESTNFADPGDTTMGGVDGVAAAEMEIGYAAGIVALPVAGDIQVYSASGALVASGRGEQLSVDGLAAGMYIVKASADGCQATRKIVIR
ncbi:MAG TPA: family 16 glycosylhydrolase [Candidatus Limisoma gallistercoris]|nr:family 16 glycosylhydrolase [Candidatus Limisoma gallistercoris]